MNELLEQNEKLVKLCQKSDPGQGAAPLLAGLSEIYPDLQFNCAVTRGGWHRLGGVVDSDFQRVTDNIAQWAETVTDGDVDELVMKYVDSVYFATHLAGKTHYFTAVTGEGPEDFIQLEIEELQEVIDRQLVDKDWFPESIEEFLDPLDFPRLDPDPVGKPYYLFRRITSIPELIEQEGSSNSSIRHLKRFLQDWKDSSASDHSRFSDHWVLSLREYMGSDGETHTSTKPIAVVKDKDTLLPSGEELSGSTLANAIRLYDRGQGYSFSWYFMMLSSKSENYSLANAVFKDQNNDYAYLCDKDLTVLSDWERHPYSV
jgi:hypothetical protein